MYSSSRSSGKTGTVGGYDIILEDTTQGERVKCPLCIKIMREPIQTTRGELACMTCFKVALGYTGKCPLDGLPINNTEYFLDKFKAKEIRMLRVLCNYCKEGCNWKGLLGDLEEHIKDCTYQPSRCTFCGELLTLSTLVEEHLKNCPKFLSESSCYHAKYGCAAKVSELMIACTDKFVSKDAHLKHLKESAAMHLMLQDKVVGEIQKENLQLRYKLDNVRIQTAESTKKVPIELNTLHEQIALITKSINVMEANMSVVLQQEQPRPELRAANNFVDQETTSVLSRKMTSINKRLSDMDLKQQLLENTIYNSKLIWKIDNVKHRLQQAVIGKVTAIQSAPCFTEKYGYKFCGRLYLNGDGIGKCTHMSLFIVIMKSEYDNLLSWPFSKRVTFCLINVADKSKSIYECFTPDQFSSSFQKPTRDLNIAAGCPMFASKGELEPSKGFLKDDSLFLEIIVG